MVQLVFSPLLRKGFYDLFCKKLKHIFMHFNYFLKSNRSSFSKQNAKWTVFTVLHLGFNIGFHYKLFWIKSLSVNFLCCVLCYNNLCTCKFIPTFFKKLNFDFRMQKSRSVCHINFSREVLSIYRNLWIVKYDLTPFNLFYRVIKFFVFCLQIVWIIIHSNLKTLNSDLSIMKCTFFWSIFCLSTEFTWKLWLSDP